MLMLVKWLLLSRNPEVLESEPIKTPTATWVFLFGLNSDQLVE